MMKDCLALVILYVLAVNGAVVDPNVQNVSPQSNTTIAELPGPTNISFNCDTFENVTQVTTAWFYHVPGITNLVLAANSDPELVIGGTPRENGPFPTFNNRLDIVNMTDRLDGRTLFCGHSTQGNRQLAFWSLRLYRPPVLNMRGVLKIAEGEPNINIDVESAPAAFPTPSSYQWSKDGVSVESDQRVTYGYPEAMFNGFLLRGDSGNYSLTATNSRLDNGQEIGADTGSFTLDVLYGPDILPGPTSYAVVAGDPLTLVCGTQVDSNPASEVQWRDPSGTTVSEGGRVVLNRGPAEVSLELAATQPSDTGEWQCDVTVSDPDVLVASQGALVPRDNPLIGSYSVSINVTVLVAPSEPRQVEAQPADIRPTNVTLSWRPPVDLGEPGVTAYRIRASDGLNPDVVYTSTDADTVQTITGLLPAVEYQFTVQAIVRAGELEAISNASIPLYLNTTTTVPAPMCDTVQSMDGSFTVEWSFVHTGGLTLTELNISYYYNEGINQVAGPVTSVTIDRREFSVDSLTTGRTYTFSITASNSMGAASVQCDSVNHLIGVPGDPKQPTVRILSATSVEISLETLSAGVAADENFYYDVSYSSVLSAESTDIMFLVPGGVAVTRMVTGLERGVTYIFRVQSRNRFGESAYVNSDLVNLNGTLPTTSTVPLGAIVGGAVGGALFVAVVILLLVIIVVFCARYREGASYQVYSKKARNLYMSPNDTTRIESTSGVKVEEVPVDIGLELQAEKELHYADLDTFSPPPGSAQKKTASSSEERVQYATIDTFKQPPIDGQSSTV